MDKFVTGTACSGPGNLVYADTRGDVKYKKAMAGVLVRRGLTATLERLEGRSAQ